MIALMPANCCKAKMRQLMITDFVKSRLNRPGFFVLAALPGALGRPVPLPPLESHETALPGWPVCQSPQHCHPRQNAVGGKQGGHQPTGSSRTAGTRGLQHVMQPHRRSASAGRRGPRVARQPAEPRWSGRWQTATWGFPAQTADLPHANRSLSLGSFRGFTHIQSGGRHHGSVWGLSEIGCLTKSKEQRRERGDPKHDAPGGGREYHVDQQRPQDTKADGELVQAAHLPADLRRCNLPDIRLPHPSPASHACCTPDGRPAHTHLAAASGRSQMASSIRTVF